MAGGENDASIPESEKVRIASDFLLHSPPGEFNDAFNSVRMLLNNDSLLKEGCAPAFAQYNKEQFVPVKLDGVERQTLVTPFNDLGNGRFTDDATKKSFRYDHLRKEASDVQSLEPLEHTVELWRKSLQTELDAYVEDHFARAGVGCVFARNGNIIICIESHQFQPKNFCNGRWRSHWFIPVGDGKSGFQELKGHVKVQVHYYEDGNVQLFSDKEFSVKVQVTADFDKTARDVLAAISKEEAAYQQAVLDNYVAMGDTTFKALRRQLPVTRSKMDWVKIPGYRIGQDMKQ
ncbi:unnamed protein product, partial [Mesorhabditis belari]|uniref:F-actin-capping protein subunit alpha n=1 Tax=Mesorhabditis belari TaxID=2138241 RepID=A0AAF3FF81_9BILA